VFVSNRIAEIQQLTNCENWRHVPMRENPADLLSRGLPLDSLIQSKLWWHGPNFLLRAECEWPTIPELEISTPEMKRTVCIVKQRDLSIFEISSNLNHLVRILTYCKRFINNCKHRDKRNLDSLTTSELIDTLHMFARLAQTQSFSAEIKLLETSEQVTKGKLSLLSSFIDETGLVRVGGRLKNSEFAIDKKHPIV